MRLGLAVSDPDRHIASPLANYTRRDLEQDGRYLRKVIDDEDIGQLVIGLPVHLSGREGEQATAARQFGQWLAELTGLPCVFWDERFSTFEAESSLWQAGLTTRSVKPAATRWPPRCFLQAYIEAGCPAETSPQPLDE